MAKGKKKGKKRGRRGGAAAEAAEPEEAPGVEPDEAEEEEPDGPSAEAGVSGGADREPADGGEEPRDEIQPGSSTRPGRARPRGRSEGPKIDPNLPRPDGERVSTAGGLVFVFIIVGLIALMVGLQFVLGR